MSWGQLPTPQQVREHGALHALPPGERCRAFPTVEVSYSDESGDQFDIRQLRADGFGLWLCKGGGAVHQHYPRIVLLGVDANDNVIYLIGFSMQANIAKHSPWAANGEWMPVTAEGLPVDYAGVTR